MKNPIPHNKHETSRYDRYKTLVAKLLNGERLPQDSKAYDMLYVFLSNF